MRTSAHHLSLKILIVDDEPLNLILLQDILEESGYTNLTCTTDSRDVVPHVLGQRPDLLLLDLMMPLLDGFAVMHELATIIPSDEYLPILVLTADASTATRRRALSAGATDFLTKPFDQTEVLLRIKNLLRSRLLHSQLQEHNRDLNLLVDERTASLQSTLAELKSAQRQVIQQERLAALGTMAAGVGHDFRNALMAVIGYTELLIQRIETVDRESAAEYLQIVFAAAGDSARIVDRLREFYRPVGESEIHASTDLNEVVQQATALTAPKWKTQTMASGISISLVIEPGEIPFIAGDPAELREVLTNLIFNAVDALPDGGTITLRTATDGCRVILEVTDTGIGMPEKVRERCLEPFFTTKGVNGTGLGLSMVYGIVQRHSGSIDIKSEPGSGTTFTVSFPSGGASSARRIASCPHTMRPLRVLVVDDEPALSRLLLEYLKSDLHTIEVASGGIDALEKFRSGEFDLVITDRAMPGMSGDDLTAAIKAITPAQPVLMVTGFPDRAVAERSAPDVVLPKPISLNSLRNAVRRALADHAA